jgi:hypothetical protein
MSSDPNNTVPAYFSWRYLAWLGWSNAISILATLQAIFAAITLDPTLVSHETYHWITIFSLVLTVVVAQAKKNYPPSPPPVKATKDVTK